MADRHESFLVKAAAAAKLTAAVCLRGNDVRSRDNYGSRDTIGIAFALLLVNGERVLKQTSAEAANGKFVST
jgi:hypothetical protein